MNPYSNASDALDKLRFLSVTDPGLMKESVELDIRVQTDKDNGIITIIDSGIGMTREEIVDCLGTIAQSGTAKFLKALKDSKDAGSDNNLIGQFGVGFYSAFLVADKVVVSTKSPRSEKQYVWEGEANASSYTIREETDPEKLIPRGTRLTLYLRHDDKGFAHPEKVQKLVKNYSQFVSFPIYTWQENGYTKEVEVDEDPAEVKKEGDDSQIEKKKKTKTGLRDTGTGSLQMKLNLYGCGILRKLLQKSIMISTSILSVSTWSHWHLPISQQRVRLNSGRCFMCQPSVQQERMT
ncbi:hypothetical protein MKX01_038003 [Papaver californicum]|nr:hypothetical protein MKX01_038003 [Papaver californicum]